MAHESNDSPEMNNVNKYDQGRNKVLSFFLSTRESGLGDTRMKLVKHCTNCIPSLSPLLLLLQPTATMDGDREVLIEKAQMAEQAERYPDMVEAMKALAEKYPELTNTERNLLSVAYKNVVGARRSACRVISSIEAKSSTEAGKIASEYRVKIAKELNETCGEVLVRMNYYEVCF